MTIPKTKTWLISANNSVATNGSSYVDYPSRSRDVADVLGTMITELIALAPATVSLVSSSDGVSNVNPADFSDTTNYWVSGSSDLRGRIYAHIQQYYYNPNCVWVILQFPEGQLCLSFSIESGNSWFQAYWTTGTFGVPASATARPTAATEYKLIQFMANSNNGGVFNHDNLGIVNSANSYADYTHKIHVGLSDDGYSFYAVSFRSYAPEFVMWFSGLSNPVTNWENAKFMFISGNPSVRQLIGPYYDSAGFQIRSDLDQNGVKAVVPCIGNSDGGTNYYNYQNVAANPIVFNAVADNDTGNFPLYPIGIYSPTYHGIKGSLTDIWWGVANGNANTYPSTGSVEYIQANDIVLPWSGASTPEFT